MTEVNDTVILEIKSVSALTSVFEKQLGTYLRLADKPCGLLINFNEAVLKQGIKRIKNGYLPDNLLSDLPEHKDTEADLT
jgi:hypothetical protein